MGCRVIEGIDIHVAHTCVAPSLSAGCRPAGNLESLESVARGPCRHLPEGQIRKGRSQKAQLQLFILDSRIGPIVTRPFSDSRRDIAI
jgi:hypothetical protein